MTLINLGTKFRVLVTVNETTQEAKARTKSVMANPIDKHMINNYGSKMHESMTTKQKQLSSHEKNKIMIYLDFTKKNIHSSIHDLTQRNDTT